MELVVKIPCSMKALTVKHRRWFSLREKEKRKKRTVTTVKISEVLVTVKYSSVKCVFFFFFFVRGFFAKKLLHLLQSN